MSVNGATVDTTALTRGATEARAAAAPVAAPPAQYATGFEGAACAPFPPEAAAVLGAPVSPEEVEVKPNGIVYLPGVAYRRILTRAFGAGAWALLPRGPARTMGELVVYHGALYILGRFVSEAVGECETRQGMSYASSLEGARTDCLTRCCKDLGVATELWDPSWRDSWLKKYTDREKDGNRWKYWLKDKAGTSSLVTGRNVGGAAPAPKGPEGDGKADQVAVADGAGIAAPTVASLDTGEEPDPVILDRIRSGVKALGWKVGYARMWLKNNFGVASLDAISSLQAAAALELVTAAQVDDNDVTYGEVHTRLRADGMVLG